MKIAIAVLIFLSDYACAPKGTTGLLPSDNMPDSVDLPLLLKKCLKAHSPSASFSSFDFLSFNLPKGNKVELHSIDLNTRHTRVEGDSFLIVKNETGVYVSPDAKSFKGNSAKFYHNLYFYFFAMPFVLADPGITYSELPEYSIDGEMYSAVKIKYGKGVGDAPDDEYILVIDPKTYQMKFLIYTVTYYEQSPSNRWSILKYTDWQTVEGLILPSKMIGYKYANDGKLGDKRYEQTFTDVKLTKGKIDKKLFKTPKVSEFTEK